MSLELETWGKENEEEFQVLLRCKENLRPAWVT